METATPTPSRDEQKPAAPKVKFTIFDPASGQVVESGEKTQDEAKALKINPSHRILWNQQLEKGTPGMPTSVPLAVTVANLLSRVNALEAEVAIMKSQPPKI